MASTEQHQKWAAVIVCIIICWFQKYMVGNVRAFALEPTRGYTQKQKEELMTKDMRYERKEVHFLTIFQYYSRQRRYVLNEQQERKRITTTKYM